MTSLSSFKSIFKHHLRGAPIRNSTSRFPILSATPTTKFPFLHGLVRKLSIAWSHVRLRPREQADTPVVPPKKGGTVHLDNLSQFAGHFAHNPGKVYLANFDPKLGGDFVANSDTALSNPTLQFPDWVNLIWQVQWNAGAAPTYPLRHATAWPAGDLDFSFKSLVSYVGNCTVPRRKGTKSEYHRSQVTHSVWSKSPAWKPIILTTHEPGKFEQNLSELFISNYGQQSLHTLLIQCRKPTNNSCRSATCF